MWRPWSPKDGQELLYLTCKNKRKSDCSEFTSPLPASPGRSCQGVMSCEVVCSHPSYRQGPTFYTFEPPPLRNKCRSMWEQCIQKRRERERTKKEKNRQGKSNVNPGKQSPTHTDPHSIHNARTSERAEPSGAQRPLLSPTVCFHGKRLHSQGGAGWSFNGYLLTFLDLWKQWWGANQNLILKEGNVDQCPVCASHTRELWELRWWVTPELRGLRLRSTQEQLTCSAGSDLAASNPLAGRVQGPRGRSPVNGAAFSLSPCHSRTSDREANDPVMRWSLALRRGAHEEQNSDMETAKMPVHCRSHKQTNKHPDKLLKFHLNTAHTGQWQIKRKGILQEGSRNHSNPGVRLSGPLRLSDTLHSSVSRAGPVGNLELQVLCTLYLHAGTVF